MGELKAEIDKWKQTHNQLEKRIVDLVKSEEYQLAKDLALKGNGCLSCVEGIEILMGYTTELNTAQSLEDLAKIKRPKLQEFPPDKLNLSDHLDFINKRLENKIDEAVQEYSEKIESDLNRKRYIKVAEQAEELKKIAMNAPELGIETGDIENISIVSRYGRDIKRSKTYKNLLKIKGELSNTIKGIEEEAPLLPFINLDEYLNRKILKTRSRESRFILEMIERYLNERLFYAANERYTQLEELGIYSRDIRERIKIEDRKDPKITIEDYKKKLKLLKNTDDDSKELIQMIKDLQFDILQYKEYRDLETISRKRLDSLLSDLNKFEKRLFNKSKIEPAIEIREEQATKTANQLLCSYNGKIEDILTFYRGVVDFYRILSLAEGLEDSRIICLCSSLKAEEDKILWKKLKSLNFDNLVLRETNISIPLQVLDEILVWEERVLTSAINTVSPSYRRETFSKYDPKRKEKILSILSYLEEFGYKISDYLLDLPSFSNRCIVPLKDIIIVDISVIIDNLEFLGVLQETHTHDFWDSTEKFMQIYPNPKSIYRLLNKGKMSSDTKKFVKKINNELEKIKGERKLVYIGRYRDLSKLVVDKYLTDFFKPLNGSQFIVSKLNYNMDFSIEDRDLMDFLNEDYGQELPKEYLLYDTFSYQLKGSLLEIPCFNISMENDHIVPRKNGRPAPYTRHMLVEDTGKETTLYLPSLASGIEENNRIKKSMDSLVTGLIKTKYRELNPDKGINVKQIDWCVTDALVISRKNDVGVNHP